MATMQVHPFLSLLCSLCLNSQFWIWTLCASGWFQYKYQYNLEDASFQNAVSASNSVPLSDWKWKRVGILFVSMSPWAGGVVGGGSTINGNELDGLTPPSGEAGAAAAAAALNYQEMGNRCFWPIAFHLWHWFVLPFANACGENPSGSSNGPLDCA